MCLLVCVSAGGAVWGGSPVLCFSVFVFSLRHKNSETSQTGRNERQIRARIQIVAEGRNAETAFVLVLAIRLRV
jgi:hypothetical protein